MSEDGLGQEAVDDEDTHTTPSFNDMRPTSVVNGTHIRTASTPVASLSTSSNKRKRSAAEDEDQQDQPGSNSPPSAKKHRQEMQEKTDRLIREMREAAKGMEDGTEFYREQIGLLEDGTSPFLSLK